MNLEMAALWAAIVCYACAGAIAIGALVLCKKTERTPLALLVAGLTLHALAIGWRWERLGHGPYVTFFEIMSSNLWSLMTIFTFCYWRIPKLRPATPFVMPVFFLLMGWLTLLDRSAGPLPATYHTVWLFIHIGFSKLFLGPIVVAVGLALVILLRRAGRFAPHLDRLPASPRLDELAWRLMALAFVFEILMLITGAIWAQDAWGRYWDWDPLETWAFLTWLMLAFSLHARLTFKLQPAHGALLILIVFGLAFLTFFGTPFISEVAHQGAI
ncbi:MAG TPA: cytochrome c biogenesis protein CcsA [Rhodocyclaceae bacterium]|nr:cytochrome c biogenesis protein CcsA [Rhodocyclaceae bacterium]